MVCFGAKFNVTEKPYLAEFAQIIYKLKFKITQRNIENYGVTIYFTMVLFNGRRSENFHLALRNPTKCGLKYCDLFPFQVMYELRKRNELCDVTLKVNNQNFSAHKVCILHMCVGY